LFFCDRAVERDVERRVVRTDPRALLHDVLAERLAQRLVQQVGRGVVAHDLAAPFLVDGRRRLLARNPLTGDDDAQMRYRSLRWLLRVLASDETARRLDGPCIADLAARLGIKRRPVQEDLELIALVRDVDVVSIASKRGHPGLAVQL